MNLTPFQFENKNLRVVRDEYGEPWFNAADVCDALELGNARQALESHVDAEDVQKLDTLTPGGRQRQNHVNESGLYALILGSTKDAAKRFKRWVTRDVLPEIRKTGAYVPPSARQQAGAADAFRLVPVVVRAARALGLDKNAAAISANQVVTKLTGTNVLRLLGHTHIEADNQTAMYFTPTELGERIGISGRKLNLLLAEAGLQAKKGEHWVPLAAAEGFCRILDTGKRHGDGTMIQQLKWADNVLGLIDQAAAA